MYKNFYSIFLLFNLFIYNDVYSSFNPNCCDDAYFNIVQIQYKLSKLSENSYDEEQRASWCLAAAQQGVPEAQLELGDRYDIGKGVIKNDLYTIYWYEQAANQGLTEAQYNLSLKFDNGEGVVQNSEIAFKWYMKAAVLNDDQAQYAVGTIYQSGEGVDKNIILAMKWHNLSAQQGNKLATEMLITLKVTVQKIKV